MESTPFRPALGKGSYRTAGGNADGPRIGNCAYRMPACTARIAGKIGITQDENTKTVMPSRARHLAVEFSLTLGRREAVEAVKHSFTLAGDQRYTQPI